MLSGVSGVQVYAMPVWSGYVYAGPEQMSQHSTLQTFDGLDNRREVMILLQRLGSDERRARFIESLIPSSINGFADAPMRVRGPCDPVAAYFMLVGVCNELGVPIDEAARRLEAEVRCA